MFMSVSFISPARALGPPVLRRFCQIKRDPVSVTALGGWHGRGGTHRGRYTTVLVVVVKRRRARLARALAPVGCRRRGLVLLVVVEDPLLVLCRPAATALRLFESARDRALVVVVVVCRKSGLRSAASAAPRGPLHRSLEPALLVLDSVEELLFGQAVIVADVGPSAVAAALLGQKRLVLLGLELLLVELGNLLVGEEPVGDRADAAGRRPSLEGFILALLVELLEDRHLVLSAGEELVDLLVAHLAVVLLVALVVLGFQQRSLQGAARRKWVWGQPRRARERRIRRHAPAAPPARPLTTCCRTFRLG
jgi:hypothetical protein